MTPPNETPRKPEQDKRLEDILQTVRSIDRNVGSILERLNDHFDDNSSGPVWSKDYDTYLDDNDY